MEREIERLLAILDSSTLKILPCFTDQSSDINFRIGLNEGPQISFRKETSQMYYLTIRNANDRIYPYPIIIGTDNFIKCQNIAEYINLLNKNPEYTQNLNASIAMFLGNLITIVNSIIERVSPEDRYFKADFEYSKRGIKDVQHYIYYFKSVSNPTDKSLRAWFFQFMDRDNTLNDIHITHISETDYKQISSDRKTTI